MATERLLLLKRRPYPVVVSDVEDDDDQNGGRRRIRCPRCHEWSPHADWYGGEEN